MSRPAESIAKEIQSEHLWDKLYYYTEVIEDYGNDRVNQTLQELKERVEKRIKELQNIIDEDKHESRYLAVKESRIDELKRVIKTIEDMQDE